MVYRQFLLRVALGLSGTFLAASAVAQVQVSSDSPATVPGDQPPAQPDAQEEEIRVIGEKPEEARKKIVCRRSVATGSIMAKRVCRSQADWERVTAKSIEDVERLRAERRARDHIANTREASN